MRTYKPHKKLYYTSGLISLLLLPILCVLYLQKTKVFEPKYTIELNMWTPEASRNYNENGYDYYIHPIRNFIKIYLTGNEKEDKIKLDFVQLQMRDLLKNKDTILGIHLVFGNQSKYWALVETLNICFKEKARTYVLVGNDFWFYNYYPKPIKPKEEIFKDFCSTRFYSHLAQIEEEKAEDIIPRNFKITPNSLIVLYISLSALFMLMCGIETYKVFRLHGRDKACLVSTAYKQ